MQLVPAWGAGEPDTPGRKTESLDVLLLARAGETGGVRLMTLLGEGGGCVLSHSAFLVVGGVVGPGGAPEEHPGRRRSWSRGRLWRRLGV